MYSDHLVCDNDLLDTYTLYTQHIGAKTMTREQYRSWIRMDLLELSARKFPNNPRLQMLYQIGFLQAQLAQSMADDNRASYKFNQAITHSNDQLNEL